jgi:hypothetical protein
MSNQYFANFPEIQYKFSDGNYATIKDLFRKAKIENERIDSIINYTYYEVQEGDRPDVVASRLYGDGDLYWTFFLVNDFLGSMNDWYRDSVIFDAFMNEKYPGYVLNATNSTDILTSSGKFLLGEAFTSSNGATGRLCEINATMKRIVAVYDGALQAIAGNTITGNISGRSFTLASTSKHRDAVHHYLETSGVWSNLDNPTNTVVTNEEHERNLNEEKRRIKIIEPRYIRQVVREFESIMSIT